MANPNREEVLGVFKKHLREILGAWEEARFDPKSSIREMGVDSVDSVLILVDSMHELGVQVFEVKELEKLSLNQIADELESGSKSGKADLSDKKN